MRMSVEGLLNQYLVPTSQIQTETLIIQALCTTDGQSEFFSLLKSGNQLAFVFLKNHLKKLIKYPEISQFLNHSQCYFADICYTAEPFNKKAMFKILEMMSHHEIIGQQFVDILFHKLENITPDDADLETTKTSFWLLRCAFSKYETQPKTVELLREISAMVDRFGHTIFVWMHSLTFYVSFDLFYLLTFQDLAVPLELKAEEISRAIERAFLSANEKLGQIKEDILLNGSQSIYNTEKRSEKEKYVYLCEVFNKIGNNFILKYSDCCNPMHFFLPIAESVVKIPEPALPIQTTALFTICRTKNRKGIAWTSRYMIQAFFILSKIRLDISDPAFYNRHCSVPSKDPFRGCVTQMINIVENILNFYSQSLFEALVQEQISEYETIVTGYQNPENPSAIAQRGFEEAYLKIEPIIFICTILKQKSRELVNQIKLNGLLMKNEVIVAAVINFYLQSGHFDQFVTNFTINSFNNTFSLCKKIQYCNFLHSKYKRILMSNRIEFSKFSEPLDIRSFTNKASNIDQMIYDAEKEGPINVFLDLTQKLFSTHVVAKVLSYTENRLDDEYTSRYIFKSIFMDVSNIKYAFEYIHRIFSTNSQGVNILSNFSMFSILGEVLTLNTPKSTSTAVQTKLETLINQEKLVDSAQQLFSQIYEANEPENIFFILQIQSLMTPLHPNRSLALFSNQTLWESSEIQIPLSILTISLLKNNLIDKSTIKNLCSFLIHKNYFCAYMILRYVHDYEMMMEITQKNIKYDILLILLSQYDHLDIPLITRCLEMMFKTELHKDSLNALRRALTNLHGRLDGQNREYCNILIHRDIMFEQKMKYILPCVIEAFEI